MERSPQVKNDREALANINTNVYAAKRLRHNHCRQDEKKLDIGGSSYETVDTCESQIIEKPTKNLKDESSNGGAVWNEFATISAEGRENCTSLDVTVNCHELVDSSRLKCPQRQNDTHLGDSMTHNATYGKPISTLSPQGEYVMDLEGDEEEPYEIMVSLQPNSSYYSVLREPPAVVVQHIGETTNNNTNQLDTYYTKFNSSIRVL